MTGKRIDLECVAELYLVDLSDEQFIAARYVLEEMFEMTSNADGMLQATTEEMFGEVVCAALQK